MSLATPTCEHLCLKYTVLATKVVSCLSSLGDCLRDVELRSGNTRISHHLQTEMLVKAEVPLLLCGCDVEDIWRCGDGPE